MTSVNVHIPFEWAAGKPIVYADLSDELDLDEGLAAEVVETMLVLLEGAAVVFLTGDSLQEGATLYFDPRLHPRDRMGRFRDVLAGLRSGETLRLGDGSEIKRIPGNRSQFEVSIKDGPRFKAQGARAVAEKVTAAVVAKPRLKTNVLVEMDEWPPAKGPVAQRLLGDQADTQDLYAMRRQDGSMVMDEATGKPRYQADRVRSVWGPIIADFFNGKTPPPAGGKKVAMAMAGGPASGKTTVLKSALGQGLTPPEANTIEIDPDRIKSMLPEWDTLIGEADADGNHPDADRYTGFATHEESSDIAAEILRIATDKGFHVVVDGSGDGKSGKFVSKLEKLNAKGYDVEVVYVNAPTERAWTGAQFRALKDGRWMPEFAVRDYHQKISERFPEVASLDFLTKLHVFEAGTWDGTVESRLMAKLDKDGRVAVEDQEWFQRFLDKADEQPVPSISSGPPVPRRPPESS